MFFKRKYWAVSGQYLSIQLTKSVLTNQMLNNSTTFFIFLLDVTVSVYMGHSCMGGKHFPWWATRFCCPTF